MKRLSYLLFILCLSLFCSCQPKEQVIAQYPDGTRHITQAKDHWRYYYPSGELFAEAEFDEGHELGHLWKIYSPEGEDYLSATYDSLVCSELGPMQTPGTFYYHHADTITAIQFFSDCNLRSVGQLVDGKREGRWFFYHPNGQVQTEAIFQGGVENGVYTVFRENGTPYFRGLYINGHRAGIWEIYDEEANLVTTQNYDK